MDAFLGLLAQTRFVVGDLQKMDDEYYVIYIFMHLQNLLL